MPQFFVANIRNDTYKNIQLHVPYSIDKENLQI